MDTPYKVGSLLSKRNVIKARCQELKKLLVRQTDRQMTDRWTSRQAGRQTEKQADRQT